MKRIRIRVASTIIVIKCPCGRTHRRQASGERVTFTCTCGRKYRI